MTIDGTYRPRRPAFSVGFPTGLRAPAGVLCGQEVSQVKSFFARLYNGEIHPGKNVVPRSKKYRQALEQSKASMLTLSKTLSRRQGELLDQAMWERFLVEQLESTAMYGAGVRFGIELMLELPRAARVRPVIRLRVKKTQ